MTQETVDLVAFTEEIRKTSFFVQFNLIKSTLIHKYQHKWTRFQHKSIRIEHESTQVRHESTQINTSPTRVNTSQTLVNTSKP